MSVALSRVLAIRQVKNARHSPWPGCPSTLGGRGMVEDTLITESLRAGAGLDGARLVTRKIRRLAAGDATADQPEL
jgi:hypothetical protein